MEPPLVSIIIPIYNVDLTMFDFCINSVLKQSYTNLEIILINDGSNKTISGYLDKMVMCDKRIRAYHQQHEGVSTARNLGIKKASGDYITFVDADDSVSLDMIKVAVDYAITHNADIVLWKHLKVKDHAKSKQEYCPDSSPFTIYRNHQIIDLQKDIWIGSESKKCAALKSLPLSVCKLYVSKLIKENNIFFDCTVSIGEDTLFALEALEYTKILVAIDKTMYFHKIHEGSLSHGYHPNALIKWRNNRKAFRKYLMDGKLSSALYKTYDLQVIFAVKTLLINTFAHPLCDLKRKDLKKILESSEFADSLSAINWNDIKNDMGAIVILFLYKMHCYELMILIGKLRRKQLNTTT